MLLSDGVWWVQIFFPRTHPGVTKAGSHRALPISHRYMRVDLEVTSAYVRGMDLGKVQGRFK